MSLIALFVIQDDCGELLCFSREVEDSTPETLQAAVNDDGIRLHEVSDVFIIEGQLYNPGREALGNFEEDEEDEEE